MISSLSHIFSCQSFQIDSFSSINKEEFKSFWDRLKKLNRVEEKEVTSLNDCSWCCNSVTWFRNVWFNWFKRSLTLFIFSKQVFHICSLDILSNNSQAFTSRSCWVQRLFKSSRKISESYLIQCCSCFTFFISHEVEASWDSSRVWEWDKEYWCFCTSTKCLTANFLLSDRIWKSRLDSAKT